MKKGICTLQLNSITNIEDDPTLLKCEFSIIDFNESGNHEIVPKELALEAAPTLKGKPLLCVYTPNTSVDNNNLNDHFNDHGEVVLKDRYGEEYLGSNSIAIGTALDGGYLKTIKDKDGNDLEVLACAFYVWADRNIPIVQLLLEIYNSGLPLYSSCEYWYSNYEVNNGVATLKSPILFSGHCLLDSGENESKVVPPAYDSSKLLDLNNRWNKAISEAIKKEGESKMEKQKNDDTYKITINNTKDSADMSDIWDIDEGKYFKKIKGSTNAKSVFEEAYARCDMPDKIDDILEKDVGYPHHIIKDDNTMVIAKAGIQAGVQRGRAQGLSDDSEEMKHFQKHYKTLGLEWPKAEESTNSKKEGEKVENNLLKQLCDMSFGDVRDALFLALSKVMMADEFNSVWISTYDVFDTYFILETYNGTDWIYYKINYTKTETDVTIDYTNKIQVEWSQIWIPVATLTDVQNQLNTANDTIKNLNSDKTDLTTKFTDATNKVTSLNAQVEELKPYKEKAEKDALDKALNEKKEFYSTKFMAVNAKEKFDSEEVQNLIKLSINNTDEGNSALVKLNSMLVDLVKVDNETKQIKENGSKKENLVPTAQDFDSRYGFND